MRKLLVFFVVVVLVFAVAAPAFADQPSQGQENSQGCNGGATAPGPHCHINTRASGNGPHGDILVAVIHGGGHVATNTAIGASAVFQAIACPFEI